MAVRLYDHSGYLNTGKQLLGMWMVRLIFVLHTPLVIPAVPPQLRVLRDQTSCFPLSLIASEWEVQHDRDLCQ